MPANIELNEAYGRIAGLLQSGDAREAEALAEGIMKSHPESAHAWFLLGAARHKQNRPSDALDAHERALDLDPALEEARKARAMLLCELDRQREALLEMQELIRRRPAWADFRVDAAIIHEMLGEADQALMLYGDALTMDPANFRARLNRGALLARLGRLEEALAENIELARRHIGSAAAQRNLADAFLQLDRYAESLAAAERALRLAPKSADLLMLRGLALAMLGRNAEAAESFLQARSADPRGAGIFLKAAARSVGLADESSITLDPRQIRLARLLERQKTCDWAERDRLVSGMKEMAADLRRNSASLEEKGLYHSAFSLPLDAAEQQALAMGIALGVMDRIGAAMQSAERATPEMVERSGRIRLGFVSPNFREHPSAKLHWRHLALRDRSRFETFCYSLHSGEGQLRRRIIESCDVFREVSEFASRDIADSIASDGIDILVDLAGHLDYARPEVLALRPAPLQVSYLGFPGAIGKELIDYRITDSYTTPHGETACWSEKLVFLPTTLFIYNDRETIAAAPPSRSACGLPGQGFVFCCFNASYKIEPDVFGVWMQLLTKLPGSVIWLLDGGEAVRRNLRREAAVRGIAPERLVFAPRLASAEHLARHACADLFLDTFYCGAHTTAADALWAGLPVLTCLGSTMAARMGASIVRAAGLPELIAPDAVAYESMALHLATHPVELSLLRERLAHGRITCELFATEKRVRELDCAFEMMWQRHLAGLSPESFAVPGEARA